MAAAKICLGTALLAVRDWSETAPGSTRPAARHDYHSDSVTRLWAGTALREMVVVGQYCILVMTGMIVTNKHVSPGSTQIYFLPVDDGVKLLTAVNT